MSYFMLTCPEPLNENGEALMEIHNAFEVGDVWDWSDGLALEPDEKPVPTPIEVDFDPLRGYSGSPKELEDVGVPLMSARLAEALLEAGVDNIELFPTKLRNTATGEVFDYRAFKVVGLVAAADLSKSDWKSYDAKPVADLSIHELAFDESKAHDLLMFRLAENINGLVVHEKVRDHILSKGIDTLDFVKPEDWVHL